MLVVPPPALAPAAAFADAEGSAKPTAADSSAIHSPEGGVGAAAIMSRSFFISGEGGGGGGGGGEEDCERWRGCNVHMIVQ
jgi:hypothetical protein